VSGDGAATYNVSLPSSVNLTDGSGHAMMLNTFAVSGDGDSNPLTRLLRNDGTGLGIDTFGVGAKVNVGANQPPGTYNGTFVVTVQYN
jgi:spore coat protein U-like protein